MTTLCFEDSGARWFSLNVNLFAGMAADTPPCGGHISGFVTRESRKPALPLPASQGCSILETRVSFQGSGVGSCSRGEDKCSLLRGLSGHLVKWETVNLASLSVRGFLLVSRQTGHESGRTRIIVRILRRGKKSNLMRCWCRSTQPKVSEHSVEFNC